MKQKLTIPQLNEVKFICISQILYLNALSNYTEINLISGNKITCSKTLKYFEQKLVDTHLIRIHDKYIINTEFVISISKNRTWVLRLGNDLMFPISDSYKSEVIAFFDL